MAYQKKKEHILGYAAYLKQEEKSPGTVGKYLRDIQAFFIWLDGKEVDREQAMEWKESIKSRKYAPITINSMLSALNGFFGYMRWEDCRVKFLRIQRRMFRDQTKELTKNEYFRLVNTARAQNKERLALLIESICSTGIRVSEVAYITVESVRSRKAEIYLKGKIRTILMPGKLCRKLLKYAKKERITSGEIFITKNKRSLSRRQIWQEMKRLCNDAKVEASKVFPHNLRHLFAVTFYRTGKDIVRLADVLGHSSIETTRLYLLSTGKEHVHQLERLGLIC